jgi:hypothetical protein
LTVGSQNPGLNLKSSAECNGQMRFGVERSLLKQLASERLGLLGCSVSLIELVSSERFACGPRESLEIRRIDAMLGAVDLQLGIGSGEIPLRERGADIFNNTGKSQG